MRHSIILLKIYLEKWISDKANNQDGRRCHMKRVLGLILLMSIIIVASVYAQENDEEKVKNIVVFSLLS